MKKLFFLAAAGIMFSALTATKSVAQPPRADVEAPKEIVVLFQTTMGDIMLKLYNETPLHRDNFVKLVEGGFYDGLLFHRVIKDFMIQGGDPNSRNAQPGQMLGTGDPGYTVPAEILPQFKHKKGSLAAAHNGNPEKRSSGSQFYIVHNSKGTPHLDGLHTVFGETIDGFDVIDKIASVQTATANRPVEDVKIIKASIVK